jgi:hypothetical protein
MDDDGDASAAWCPVSSSEVPTRCGGPDDIHSRIPPYGQAGALGAWIRRCLTAVQVQGLAPRNLALPFAAVWFQHPSTGSRPCARLVDGLPAPR